MNTDTPKNGVPRHAAEPTQVEYPWRTTVRTVFQALIGLAAAWGLVVEALGLSEQIPIVAASLTVTAAITRLMALPVVNDWLATYVPWLAATRKE